jgi:uncharacterized lipoprotein YmbA
MKKLFSVVAVLILAGCASSNSQYYEAVQKAAEANSAAAQSKFEALSRIAASGDGQAASAAVMALALTQTPTVQPIPQQSEAIQWMSILAAPLSNVAALYLQNDATKALAKYNARVDMARISADASTEQALYGAFVDTASAGYEAIGNVDYTPFIEGMVTISTAGIDGVVDVGTTGINGVLDMGTVGINGISDVSTTGFNTLLSLDQGNNDLLGGVWSQYTATISEIITNVPQISCTITNNADGTSSVNCAP